MVEFILENGFGPFRTDDLTFDLGHFALITGENGSGKTQLLKHMAETMPGPSLRGRPSSALYFNTETLHGSLRDESIHISRSERIQDALRIASQWDESLDAYTDAQIQAVSEALALDRRTVSRWVEEVGRPLRTFSGDDYEELVSFDPVLSSVFHGAWENRFTAYMELLVENEIRSILTERFPVLDMPSFQPTEFRARFGEAPWERLNRALQIMNLDLRFEEPELARYVAQRMDPLPSETRIRVTPVIRRQGGGSAVPIDQLSSGQKTILALATSVYVTEYSPQLPALPALLALDEIDSALHPSMVRALMQYVTRELVERLGIDVLMTTHSPTTVALAPPDSIWLLDAFSDQILRKTSTDRALSHLLVGVPALSVKFENRRVVIVESRNDARWYQRLFQILERDLDSERSLVFVPVGGTKQLGPEGCDRVLQIVADLRNNGNDTVWGLIDRDQRTTASPGVFYSAERYSIENYVLDPLSLGLHLLRAHPGTKHGLDEFAEVQVVSDAQPAQQLVDFMTGRLFAEATENEPLSTSYAGGLRLTMDRSWFELRGHDLEKRVRDEWPMLAADKSRLLDRIINGVWSAYPQAIPEDLVSLLRTLLEAP